MSATSAKRDRRTANEASEERAERRVVRAGDDREDLVGDAGVGCERHRAVAVTFERLALRSDHLGADRRHPFEHDARELRKVRRELMGREAAEHRTERREEAAAHQQARCVP